MPEPPPSRADSTKKSKTARKRDAQQLQAMGQELTKLKPEQWHELDLPSALVTALELHRRINSREAQRRQLQFIGKLMRDVDTDAIQAALDELAGQSAQARYEFHQLEHWRDQLMADPNAVTACIEAFPTIERQQLRQLVKKYHSASDPSAQKDISRRLFQLLKSA